MTTHTQDRASRGELLTIAEAAAVLRSPVATLRYWRHLGTGPHSFKIGRRIFYWAAEVEEWLDQQCRRDLAP
jgi:predicted DNA-binding transcriptional regulator AlpA